MHYECFEDANLNLVYADYEIIDLENRRIGKRVHRAGSLEEILSLRILLPQSSVFFRLSATNIKNSLSLDHDYIADVVFFNQICLRGQFRFVPEIWSQVRKHPGSRTGKRNPGSQYLDAIDTALASMPRHIKKKAIAGGLLLRARYEASSQRRLAALLTIAKGFIADPFLMNHWLLPRALAYIMFGPGGIDYFIRFRKFLSS